MLESPILNMFHNPCGHWNPGRGQHPKITISSGKIPIIKGPGFVLGQVGAYLMADIAHISGLVATGEHPSPFPFCDVTWRVEGGVPEKIQQKDGRNGVYMADGMF